MKELYAPIGSPARLLYRAMAARVEGSLAAAGTLPYNCINLLLERGGLRTRAGRVPLIELEFIDPRGVLGEILTILQSCRKFCPCLNTPGQDCMRPGFSIQFCPAGNRPGIAGMWKTPKRNISRTASRGFTTRASNAATTAATLTSNAGAGGWAEPGARSISANACKRAGKQP